MKSEWKKLKIGDVCTIKHGYAFKGVHFCDEKTEHIVTTPGNFAISGGFKLDKPKYYRGPIPQDYILSPGDIIVTMTDLSKDGDTLGYAAIVPESDNAIFLHNQRIGLIENISDSIDKGFLYWLMRTYHYQKYIVNHASGSTVKHTSPSSIASYSFQAPPLPIQRKIASILFALDDKIETNNAICRNLEEQAMAVFKRCFFTYSEQLVEDKPVYDFAEYINGAAFKQHEYGESGLPIIKIAELKSGLSSSTLFYRGEDKDEKYYIQNGDILFSWSGNPETSIDVFIWTRGDAILNQHIFNVKSRCEAKWFTYLMLKNYMPVFAKIASDKQTTGLGHVTVADLKRLTFPYNTNQILDFEKEVSIYMEQVYNTLVMNNHLSNLRDTLLPKLMNGELEVETLV